jgi:integrase
MPLKLKRRPSRPFWYMHGTVRGVSIRESTGVADAKAAEAIRARREWEIIQRSIFGREATATFVAAAVSYMEAGGDDLEGRRRYLKPIIAKLGSMPLAKIDQAVIEKTARALYPNGSPATLNRQAFTPIAAVLNNAAKRGLCAHRVVDRPAQPKGRVRWITFEEAERLLDACSPHLRPLVMFLLGTGARMSEALSLEWREVDLAAAHVTFLDTKNGEDRGVPLHARLVAELRALRHQQGRVFRTNAGLPYAEKQNAGGQIKTAFRGACRRAGIEDFSPHDCRHTWATWHYAANRDLIALMKLGGWKSERMVLRYAHVNVSQLAPSIDAGLAGWSTKSAPSTSAPAGKIRRVK